MQEKLLLRENSINIQMAGLTISFLFENKDFFDHVKGRICPFMTPSEGEYRVELHSGLEWVKMLKERQNYPLAFIQKEELISNQNWLKGLVQNNRLSPGLK